MPNKKLLKYPKKPKASASAETFERYLKRCSEIDRENAARKKENAKREALAKRVAAVKR